MVAEHFLDDKEGFNVVNHKDGNKLNNDIENLEWTNYSENSIHSYEELKQPRPKSSGLPTIIFAKNIYTNEKVIFNSIRETERKLNVSKTHIIRILDTNKKTINGWIFSKNNVEDIEKVG